MSNPFAVFRKNQKTWMVGLVLLAILAFVVAPAIQTATSAFTGGGSSGKEVVVSWTGGQITIADLQNSAAQHAALVRFLGALGEKVIENGGTPQVPNFQVDPRNGQILSVGIQGSSNEADVCRTRILASYGKRMGIEMSDETADEFIREFCDDRITTQEMQEILSEASGGRLAWFDVRELLKEELTAMIVGQTATAGLGASSPGKMYRDFEKLNLTAKVEAYPVFVDEFLTEIKDSPTEADINAIYDIGSTRVTDASSPEAGFMRRYQANIEYIESNSDLLAEKAKADITEEEIKAEYDLQVGLGGLKVPVEEPTSPSDGTDETTSDGEEGADSKGADETPSSATGEENNAEGEANSTDGKEEESSDSEPAEDANSGESEANGEASGEATEQEGSEAEDPGQGSEEGSGESSSPGEGDQSAVVDNKVRLVSFIQETQETAPPAAAAPTPQTSEESATAEQGGEESAPGQSGEGELQLSDPTGTAEGEEGAAGTEAEGTTAQDEEIATAVPAEPEMRTKTYEEAREEILDSLARKKANEDRQAKTQEILEIMQKFAGEMRQYQAFVEADLLEDENGNTREEPVRPDLKKLAEEAGLTYNETGLIDGTKLAQLPIGRAFAANSSVANVMMNPGVGLFQPLEALYLDQAAMMAGGTPPLINFLCWKSEQKGAYIPELDEVRGEVEDAWKRQKARELALVSATDLSKKVSVNSEDPWAGALSETQKALIIESDPFTWMQRFNEMASISAVPKLDTVGGEFMQQVFTSQPGQVVVAANGPKTIYYVTRVVEFSPTAEDLRDRFNADPLKSGPMNIANQEANRLVMDWYENLERELGVQWQMNDGQFN